MPARAAADSGCSALTGELRMLLGFSEPLLCGCRFQLRCLLGQPLTVAAGGVVTGELRLVAHKRQSYDVHLTLSAPPLLPGDPPQMVLAPRLDVRKLTNAHTRQLYTVHVMLRAPPLLPGDPPQMVLAP